MEHNYSIDNSPGKWSQPIAELRYNGLDDETRNEWRKEAARGHVSHSRHRRSRSRSSSRTHRTSHSRKRSHSRERDRSRRKDRDRDREKERERDRGKDRDKDRSKDKKGDQVSSLGEKRGAPQCGADGGVVKRLGSFIVSVRIKGPITAAP
ncbi:hypothetical protein CRENBAI_024739 [Crenichthys baileyi]|uniref:Uncharacterized protein n=1 Tax=Crenichthys baileyi TaxID=28760 RepID=A0AAV9QQV8_9TELE